MNLNTQRFRRAHFAAGATSAILATAVVLTTGVAAADEGLPGTTGNTANESLPGTTGNTTEPAPAPVDNTPEPVAAPAPAPAPAGGEVPNYASQAVPGLNQVAQPVQQAEPQPQIVSEPEIVYVAGEPEIQYVDREVIVDREVEVVEENGTLLLLDPEYQNQIDPVDVADDAVGNYWAYDQGTRNTLNTTAAAAGAGAAGGSLIGGAVGAAGAGVTGAAVGGLAGAAAGPAAALPLCAIGTVLVPAAGGVSCVVTSAAVGAAGGAAVGGAAGAGAGLVAGSATGAALGATGAASLVPGGTEAVQDLVADTAWDTEDTLRTDNDFRGLVGDKPSGLDGNIVPEESTETRDVDGTTLEGVDEPAGQHAAEDTTPAPEPEVPTEPRHAAPEVEVPEIPQELPEPVQQVNQWVDDTQEQVNDFVLEAQDQAPSFDTIPDLDSLLPV